MTPERLARVVIGLALALGLAVLAAHPRVKSLERRFGISVFLSAGIPFLVLGAVLSLPEIDILSTSALADLRPAFEFGLGWIGFAVGMQFDIRRLDKLPRSLGGVIALESLVPMLTTAVTCAVGLALSEMRFEDPGFVRDVLLLVACAAASAPVSVETLSRLYGRRAARMVDEVTRLDDVASLAALGILAILFRADTGVTTWILPTSAWLLVSMGLGAMLGVVAYVLIRGADSPSEEMALLIGSVAFAAGMSGYLGLSVPVICAIAGALLANLPMRDTERVRELLFEVERPLYPIFLMVVGASWRPDEWQGWVLAVAFVTGRVLGKRLGSMLAVRTGPPELPPARALALALTPQSPIAIVVIVSAGRMIEPLHPQVVRWAINAVIIGGVLTEIAIRILQRLEPSQTPDAASADRSAEEAT